MSADENISVNPDQLKKLAEPYHYAADSFEQLANRLTDITARYNTPWGNDQTGQQFGPQFQKGLQNLQDQAKAMHNTLSYYGDGLSDTGKLYTSAANDAEDTGRTLDVGFDQLADQTPLPAEPPTED